MHIHGYFQLVGQSSAASLFFQYLALHLNHSKPELFKFRQTYSMMCIHMYILVYMLTWCMVCIFYTTSKGIMYYLLVLYVYTCVCIVYTYVRTCDSRIVVVDDIHHLPLPLGQVLQVLIVVALS